jgi:hypothetical protein
MFLHRIGPITIVSNPNERVEYVHVSVRIPITVKLALDEDVKLKHMNFNSLVSYVLTKYTTFDKIAEHVHVIPLNLPLFSGVLQEMPVDRLIQLGRELGPKLIKQTFTFLGLEYDVDGLIQHYFEPMSYFSGWYTFTVIGSGQNRRLLFEHPHGPKWSAYLKTYISSIIKAATGVEPRSTADDNIVTIWLA